MAATRFLLNEAKSSLRFFLRPNNLKPFGNQTPQNALISAPILNLTSQEPFKSKIGDGPLRMVSMETLNFPSYIAEIANRDLGRVQARGQPVNPEEEIDDVDEDIDEEDDNGGSGGEEKESAGNFDYDERDSDEDSDDYGNDDYDDYQRPSKRK